jgi:fumarate reductase flavoprotein subunit
VQHCDIAIVGAGTAGIPAAIEAAQAGARVVLIEQSDRVGGTLHISAAQMSGAGTRLQRERGITDTPQAHLDDAIRISRGTCDAALVAKAAELGGATIDWLMELGFDMDPVCPAILHFHEAYRTQRTYWGRDGGRSVLRVLLPLLDAAMSRPNATLLLRTEAASLLRDASGAVTGLRLRQSADGAVSELLADAVVLASGGYAGNPELFARLTDGASLYTPALSIASGTCIEMAEAIGARIRGGEHFIPTFAGIEEADGKGRVLWDHLPSLTPQVRQPWEIYVGPDGRRFVREDVDSVDTRERALMRLPGLTFWTIFDDASFRDSPPLLPGWRADELAEAWASSPSFAAADTIEELARRGGIDPAGLAMSVQQYNAAISNRAADPLGRVHRPCGIAVPPYRAIRMHGIVLKTPAGLAVNTELNVLNGDGAPIPNLYAIGEAIGGATLSGDSFVGGMSVTPALSFGRWLGRELGRRCARAAA